MKIIPTLIIGIGSTGKRIADEFMRLYYEEFGRVAMGGIWVTSIETDEGNTDSPSIEPLFEYDNGIPSRIGETMDYLQNDVIIAGTENLDSAYAWRDPNSDVYNPAFAFIADDELDTYVTLADSGSGASNHPMIGRLLLFLNWTQITQHLTKAYHSILHVQHKMDSERFLSDHFGANVELSGAQVIVVGTGAGGTFRGMCIDIGLYLRQISTQGMRLYANITGPNDIQARDPANQRYTANYYSLLIELDHLSRINTQHQWVWPDGTEFTHRRKPYDLVNIFSVSNAAGNHLVSPDGSYSFAQLEQLVAAEIYSKIYLGVTHAINADLSNIVTRSNGLFNQTRRI